MNAKSLAFALACSALCLTAQATPPPTAAGPDATAGERRAPTFLDMKVPKLSGRVVDEAKLLTPAQRRTLAAKLAAHEKATGQQFAILTVKTLAGHAIEDVSYTIANTWKLGREKQDDGLLIVVAPNDRTARIEVGLGLERAISDELAAKIMQEQLLPALRKRAWAAGLTAALQQLMAAGRAAP